MGKIKGPSWKGKGAGGRPSGFPKGDSSFAGGVFFLGGGKDFTYSEGGGNNWEKPTPDGKFYPQNPKKENTKKGWSFLRG